MMCMVSSFVTAPVCPKLEIITRCLAVVVLRVVFAMGACAEGACGFAPDAEIAGLLFPPTKKSLLSVERRCRNSALDMAATSLPLVCACRPSCRQNFLQFAH